MQMEILSKLTDFISKFARKSTRAVHWLRHGAFPWDIEIQATHLTRMEPHHMIGVGDAATCRKSTHRAVDKFPEREYE